jgi:hypothetical protein
VDCILPQMTRSRSITSFPKAKVGKRQEQTGKCCTNIVTHVKRLKNRVAVVCMTDATLLRSRVQGNVHARCAPCGASSPPRCNRETLEGGVWATSSPAAERPTGQEHAWRTARLPEGAVQQVAFDPADMVKATLLESQSSVVKVTTRRKKRLTTAADPCDSMNREAVAPSRGGHGLVKPR